MKRGTFKIKPCKPLSRSGFKKVLKTTLKVKIKRKRRKKGEVTRLNEILWRLCREIASRIYPHFCYTCNTPLIWGSSVMQLGHFLPRSVCSVEMKYDLKNLRWQCRYCNQFKNGNWQIFEENLIKENGLEYVNELKQRNNATKGKQYDRLYFEDKISEYTSLLVSLPKN